ncbi:hypothetical protein ES705_15392 [subsurface metagenome]
MKLRNIFRVIKPFLGALDVNIDRTRQIITFKRDGESQTLTVDQLYDEIESIFSKAKPAAQTTLDPFGGGTIDRITLPGSSWLSDCSSPVTNPLGLALTEPARPLAAHWL